MNGLKTAAFASLSALLGLSACADMEEGDYLVYRVSYAAAEFNASCFEDNAMDIESIQEDTSDVGSAATFILYFREGGTPTLDLGTSVLEGTDEGDNNFNFTGRIVDIEVPPGEMILDADADGIEDSVDTVIDADHDGIDDATDETVDTDGDLLDDRFEDPLVDANLDGEDDRMVERLPTFKFQTETLIDVDVFVNGELIEGDVRSTTTTSCLGTGCLATYGGTCTITRDFDGVEMADADVSVSPGEA